MDQPTQKDQIQLSLATQILQPRAPATPLVTNEVTLWPVKPMMVFRAPPVPAMLVHTQPFCSSGKILGKNVGAFAKLEEKERKGD